MRRYELMLVLRPDTPDDRVQQILDRTTRGIAAGDGQIVKVSPWGRRRLAYPISGYREGSYFIVVFDAPSEAIDDVEHGLNITEEVMRHLVTRIERPVRRADKKEDEAAEEEAEGEEVEEPLPPPDEEELEPEGEVIDESESEAAPKAIG
jgi:small subunit ribosomal protein S6